jgi:hypothetical protein
MDTEEHVRVIKGFLATVDLSSSNMPKHNRVFVVERMFEYLVRNSHFVHTHPKFAKSVHDKSIEFYKQEPLTHYFVIPTYKKLFGKDITDVVKSDKSPKSFNPEFVKSADKQPDAKQDQDLNQNGVSSSLKVCSKRTILTPQKFSRRARSITNIQRNIQRLVTPRSFVICRYCHLAKPRCCKNQRNLKSSKKGQQSMVL